MMERSNYALLLIIHNIWFYLKKYKSIEIQTNNVKYPNKNQGSAFESHNIKLGNVVILLHKIINSYTIVEILIFTKLVMININISTLESSSIIDVK